MYLDEGESDIPNDMFVTFWMKFVKDCLAALTVIFPRN